MKKVVLLLIVLSPQSNAQQNEIDFFSFTFENDIIFSGEDGGYSNGFIGAWGYNNVPKLDKQVLPLWIAYLADKSYLTSMPNKQYALSYRIGQLIQTDTYVAESSLVEEDAPYAGLLAWEGHINAFDKDVSDQLGLTLGVVGPASGAEQTQKLFHALFGYSEPQGWEHQLQNELVFRLDVMRTWRLYDVPSPFMGAEFDILGGMLGGVGNLRSDIATGINFRWGKELENSFSSATAMPIKKLNQLNNTPNGWYLFANISGAYVANDIFIDGNTFADSHSVDLIHGQTTFSTGVVLNIANWGVVYNMLYATDEYETQTEDTRYASLTVTYNY
ncbi:MAG: lipid A deacylase LpxR family protein [Psychromonas sp.]